MIERSDRIDLPDTEWRCWRDSGCGHSTTCARRLAALPKGAPLADGLLTSPMATFGWCNHYIAAKRREQTPALVQPKPAPKGIA